LLSPGAFSQDSQKGEPRPRAQAKGASVRQEVAAFTVAQLGSVQPRGYLLLPLRQVLRPRQEDDPEGRFWWDDRRKAAAGAAQLIGARDMTLAAVLRLQGREWQIWKEKPVPDEVPALNPVWLDSVRDREPFIDIRERAPDELMSPKYRKGYQEYWANAQAIVFAAQVPADVFARAAAENSKLDFGHLYREPERHRGKVIHMGGLLGRIRELDAPLPAARQGVKVVYEAWIYRDQPGPPVVVIFPDLPEGLRVGDYDKKAAQRVAFDGYFFKIYRYRSGYTDKRGNWKEQNTLLFIAPTLKTPRPAPTPGRERAVAFPVAVLYGVLGVLCATVLLIVGIMVWYRRNDEQVRARLRQVQASRLEHGWLAETGPEGEGQTPGAASEPPRTARPEGGRPNGLPPGAVDGPQGH
jgi:hypothetical protein